MVASVMSAGAVRILAAALQTGGSGDEGGDVDAEDVISGVDGCGEDGGALCRRVYDWTESQTLADVTAFFANNVLRILLIVVGTFILLAVAKRFIRRTMNRITRSTVAMREQQADHELTPRERVELEMEAKRIGQRTDTLGVVLYSITRVAVWTLSICLVLAELGVNLGPLIAGAGIAGVALGFGAQTIVRDFLSGIFMISEDQFGVGDIVDLGEASGVVERLTLRTTVLRDIYGTVWHVPNGEVQRVGNMSQHWSKALLDVGVAYGTDVDHACDVLLSTAREMAEDPTWSGHFLDDPEVLGVETLAADAVTIRVSVKTPPAQQWAVQRELNRRFKIALDSEGIEIPFPQRTVWFRHDDGPDDGPDEGADDRPGGTQPGDDGPPDDPGDPDGRVTGRT